MGITSSAPTPDKLHLALWMASFANLGVALLQLLWFVPQIVERQTLETPFPFAYRVDSLSLTFGVAWTLMLALVAGALASLEHDWADSRHGSRWIAWSICLMSVGLLDVAYASDLLPLYVGWEIAGLALWLALMPMWSGRRWWLLVALHSPGWVLLAVLALGLAIPLAPPPGGTAAAWPLPVAVAFGAVVLARAGCWPFHSWRRIAVKATGGTGAAIIALYCLVAPYLLARALVAAPWDAVGAWALTLLGTVSLLGQALTTFEVYNEKTNRNPAGFYLFFQGDLSYPAIAAAQATVALIGFGMASSSPLAAVGAVALLLSGTLWVASFGPINGADWGWTRALGGWGTLLGGSVGVWAIAQGALGSGYGLVAVILLPVGAWLVLDEGRRTKDESPSLVLRPSSFVLRLLSVSLLIFAGLYLQGLVEWLLRPAVGAMAGGVGALQGIGSEWGVGLMVRSGEETILAALPATGIALAVALALIALYWLKRLTRRFVLWLEIRNQN